MAGERLFPQLIGEGIGFSLALQNGRSWASGRAIRAKLRTFGLSASSYVSPERETIKNCNDRPKESGKRLFLTSELIRISPFVFFGRLPDGSPSTPHQESRFFYPGFHPDDVVRCLLILAIPSHLISWLLKIMPATKRII